MRKRLTVSLFVIAFIAICAFLCWAFPFSLTDVAFADPEKNATFVSASARYGTNWKISPYGSSGHVIFAGESSNSSTVYSDLYTAYSDTEKIRLSGWANNDNNTWLVPTDGEIKDSSPITKWAFTSRAWRVGATDASLGLNDPSGSPIKIRADGWNTKLQDTSVSVIKKNADDLYITLFLTAGDYTKITPAAPIDVYVYSGAILAQNKNTSDVASGFNHYSSLTELEKITVEEGRSYLTFKLEGAGEFQIVATKGVDNGNVISGTQPPFWTGFFLDETMPYAPDKEGKADLNSSADEWETVYGNDGYIIFDYDKTADPDDLKRVAYTKGVYELNNVDYTGKVGFVASSVYSDGKTSAETDKFIYEFMPYGNGFTSSEQLISRFGINAKRWEQGEDYSENGESYAKYGTFYGQNRLALPGGGKTDVYFGGDDGSHVANLSFTITENALSGGHIYVTAFGNNCASVGDTALFENVVRVAELYNTYWSAIDKAPDSLPVARVAFEQYYNTHYYITFDITAAGDYTLCVKSYGTVSKGSVCALFFDKNEPMPTATDSHDINYVLNGEAGNVVTNPSNPSTFSSAVGVAELAEPVWTNEDKGFSGWYLGSDVSSVKIGSIPKKLNIDLKLFAGFLDYFNINYVVEHGVNNVDNNITRAMDGTVIGLLDCIPDEHYEFLGWYTTANFEDGTRVDAGFVLSSDITFYAKINEMPKFTIEYRLNGGVNGAGNPTSYYFSEGTGVFADAFKDGCAFLGWYSDENFDNRIRFVSADLNMNLTLYALFGSEKITAIITYNLDGGVNSPDNFDTYIVGNAVNLFDAKKAGYSFDGWYRESSFENRITEISEEETSDIEIFAKFTKIDEFYRINYELDNGNNSDRNVYRYMKGDVVELYDAEKEGYIFDGWFTDAEFTAKTEQINGTSAEDITLYAKFTKAEQQGRTSGNIGTVIIVISVGVLIVSVSVCAFLLIKKKPERQG